MNHYSHFRIIEQAVFEFYVYDRRTGKMSRAFRSEREAIIALYSLSVRNLINE